jgi:hypothetical protein
VRIQVSAKEGGLEEDEAGNPDGRGAAENRHELLGGNRLNEKEKKSAQKYSACKKPAGTRSAGRGKDYGINTHSSHADAITPDDFCGAENHQGAVIDSLYREHVSVPRKLP